MTLSASLIAAENQQSMQEAEQRAAEEAAARAQAEREAAEAAAQAAAYAGFSGGEEWWGEEWGEEEWWEEEGGAEYASYHQGEQGEAAPAFKSLVGEEAGSLSNGLIEGSSAAPTRSALVHACMEHQSKAWCMRYADFLGIEGLAKEAWKEIKRGSKWVWKRITSWVHKNAASIKKSLCDVTGWGSGLLAGAGAGLISENWLFAGTVGYVVGKGVEDGCNG
jgi:hypothetical protein